MGASNAPLRGMGPGNLAALSSAVLLAGAGLTETTDSGTLATFLYVSNWVPLSPEWLRRVPDDATVERRVLDDDTAAAGLARHWTATRDSHWLHWTPRPADGGPPTRFKLYVSARPDDAFSVLHSAIPVLAACGAPHFKFSRGVREMLRPDRMVVYLPSEAAVRQLAEALAPAVAGFAFQGVPFTAALDRSGLLSWGCDPPAAVRPFAASWRRWLTKKLAAYLHASDASRPRERAEFALGRLGQDGVDPSTWTPRPNLWTDQAEPMPRAGAVR